MNFTRNGRQLTALRAAEADAITSSLSLLAGISLEENDEYGVASDCRSLLFSTLELAASTPSAPALIAADRSIAEEGAFLPREGALVVDIPDPNWDTAFAAAWRADPQLAQVMVAASGGVWVPTEDVAALRQIHQNVVAVDSGDCAPRTIWGLVGVLGLVGAGALLFGGLFVGKGKK